MWCALVEVVGLCGVLWWRWWRCVVGVLWWNSGGGDGAVWYVVELLALFGVLWW